MFGRYWLFNNQMIVMVTDDAHAAGFLYESIDVRCWDSQPLSPLVCPHHNPEAIDKEIN